MEISFAGMAAAGNTPRLSGDGKTGRGCGAGGYQVLITGRISLPNRPMLDIVASWDILDS